MAMMVDSPQEVIVAAPNPLASWDGPHFNSLTYAVIIVIGGAAGNQRTNFGWETWN
jgi:hypothetical protein